MTVITELLARVRVRHVLLLGAAIRALLLALAAVLDSLAAVKYTDVDLTVFRDAAAALAAGDSPYTRATYRYTPLLAGALTLVDGRVLFVALDLLAGWIIARTLAPPKQTSAAKQKQTTVKQEKETLEKMRWPVLGAAAWLLNPLVINVSTRVRPFLFLSVPLFHPPITNQPNQQINQSNKQCIQFESKQ